MPRKDRNPLSISSVRRYHGAMDAQTHRRLPPLLITALAGAGLLLSLAAFLGWIVQGPEMFLTMAESGLSWCL
ncbi:hypothetical protein ASD31_02230 [Rhizobium sp. Root482]|nr:hypothetical protein ASD31_02230 [Rhizobium sp. Root482]